MAETGAIDLGPATSLDLSGPGPGIRGRESDKSEGDGDAGQREVAAERGIWTWPRSVPTPYVQWRRFELTVGDATLGFTPAEVAGLLSTCVTPRGRMGG